jgi:hypothetical protein
MKHLNRYLIATLAVLTAVSAVTLPAAAQTTDLPPERIEAIQGHCKSAQSTIQRTQKSDLVSRINQGQSYEYLLSLMASLNSRIALNKLSQSRMSEVASEMQNMFAAFDNHYTQYKASVDRALNIACAKEPAKFYELLTDVRENRNLLSDDTIAMQQLITEYGQQVAALEKEIQQS